MPEDQKDLPLLQWRNRTFELAITQYADNENTCIVLLNPANGTVELKASVNLYKLAPHLTFIKNYSENRGILDALLKFRFIRATGHVQRNGSEEFALCELAPRFAEQFGISVPELEEPSSPNFNAPQETAADSEPANGVPSRASIPSEEPEEDSPASWGDVEAQQNAALIEKAQQEAAERSETDDMPAEATAGVPDDEPLPPAA